MDSRSHLNAGITDVADLLAVELLPLLAIKLLDEGDDVLWAHHVDEGVAHVALILEINWQVEEIIGSMELFIDGCQQHLLRVLIGNVLDHQRCTLVISYKAALNIFIEKEAPTRSALEFCQQGHQQIDMNCLQMADIEGPPNMLAVSKTIYRFSKASLLNCRDALSSRLSNVNH